MSQDFVRQLPGSGLVSHRREGLGDILHIDFPLLLLLIAISAYGLLILYSAAGQQTAPVVSQSIKIMAGVGVMFVIAQISPIFYMRLAPWIFLGGLLLLVLVYFIGIEVKGSNAGSGFRV